MASSERAGASPVLLRPKERSITQTLKTPAQLRAHLADLQTRESELSSQLNDLVSDRSKLDEAVRRLKSLVPRIKEIELEVDGRSSAVVPAAHAGAVPGRNPAGNALAINGVADGTVDEGLVGRVNKVWETSERVGGKVRKLDMEVERVRESVDRVGEVGELRSALQQLQDSLMKSDWESATRACKRAMDVRKEVLEGGFTARVVPTPALPLPPPQTLATLRSELLDKFRALFVEAAKAKDEQMTSRVFRLFPEIGAEEDGLTVYGDFVVGLVKGRSASGGKPSSPTYYIHHLTSLLESIALIIDQHQSVVEKYYGEGKMKIVVKRLQAEGDGVVRGLVEGWEEERRVGRLISETKQSSFSYLANPVQAPQSTGNALSALSSQAQHNLASLPNAATSLLSSYAGTSPAKKLQHGLDDERDDEPSGPDPRDVDRVLGEMLALGGRWSLYRKFVWSRLVVDGGQPNTEYDASGLQTPTAQLDVVDDSEGQKVIENMLKTYYEPLEEWFLRISIEKAHKLDIPDLSTRPHLSSVVDDTFYLLKLVLQRLVSSGSVSALTSMRTNLAKIMERDYLGVLQKKMEAVYAGGGASLSGLAAGLGVGAAGRDAERERRERDLRVSFSVLLNDLDISAQYMERLLEDTLNSNTLAQSFLTADIPRVQTELRKFGDISTRMRGVVKSGLDQLFNQLTRPRLRALLDDCYKGVSYMLDEDAYAEAELVDVVRKRFVKGWEPLVEGYKESFTDSNFQLFFSMTVEVLVRPWEKMVTTQRFTELGAIRFDRDIRAVANFLSSQSSYGGARDKFTRLQQISTLLNLDADEDPEDFYGNSGIPWRLSKQEYNNIVALRV